MSFCRLYVTVLPRSRVQDISIVDARTLRVRIHAPPDDGKANEAVRDLLAKTLKVPRSRVLIVAGEHARKKIIVLPLSLREVVARLGGSAIERPL